MGRQRCESIETLDGEPCPCYASWVIHAADRAGDKKHACGRHLHSACRAIAVSQAGTGVKLILQPV